MPPTPHKVIVWISNYRLCPDYRIVLIERVIAVTLLCKYYNNGLIIAQIAINTLLEIQLNFSDWYIDSLRASAELIWYHQCRACGFCETRDSKYMLIYFYVKVISCIPASIFLNCSNLLTNRMLTCNKQHIKQSIYFTDDSNTTCETLPGNASRYSEVVWTFPSHPSTVNEFRMVLSGSQPCVSVNTPWFVRGENTIGTPSECEVHEQVRGNRRVCSLTCRCLEPSVCGFLHHDDVIKWKHFPRYWPFVRRIHRSPVNSPHKGQWRGALMFTLICARINGWVNKCEAGDLRRNRAHYDVIVMITVPNFHFGWWTSWHCAISNWSRLFLDLSIPNWALMGKGFNG